MRQTCTGSKGRSRGLSSTAELRVERRVVLRIYLQSRHCNAGSGNWSAVKDVSRTRTRSNVKRVGSGCGYRVPSKRCEWIRVGRAIQRIGEMCSAITRGESRIHVVTAPRAIYLRPETKIIECICLQAGWCNACDGSTDRPRVIDITLPYCCTHVNVIGLGARHCIPGDGRARIDISRTVGRGYYCREGLALDSDSLKKRDWQQH